MAGLKVEIVAGKDLSSKLDRMRSSVPSANAAGTYAVGCAILLDSLRRVPVDTGTLKGSGYVTIPGPGEHGCTVGYGGPAQAYAAVQHEALNYAHEVGEAKYLENAVAAVEPRATAIYWDAMMRALRRGDTRGPEKRVPSDPYASARRAKRGKAKKSR